VDKLNYAGIVGSVAGDDTLLIVCESDESALLIVDKINEFMK
jgi:arginine repressor